MKRSLFAVFRDLLGRSDEVVTDRVKSQVELVEQAVDMIRVSCSDGEDITASIERLEKDGDARRCELTQFLSSTLTTPIDHEDLFRLSRSIDDVLDNLCDFVHELDFYQPPDREVFIPMLDSIAAGVDALRDAVGALRQGPAQIVAASRSSDHAASQIRHRYEEALRTLFDQDLNSGSLRTRECLRRLDVVGLRLGESASALADGGLKRIE